MSELRMTDKEERMFQHAASAGYGVEVVGGSAKDRETAVKDALSGSFTVIDGRDIDSSDEFLEAIVIALSDETEESLEKTNVFPSDVARTIGDDDTLLVLEFDSMDADTQKSVAQAMKGVIESVQHAFSLAYTCEEPEALVTANPDLTGRVRSWQLEDGDNE